MWAWWALSLTSSAAWWIGPGTGGGGGGGGGAGMANAEPAAKQNEKASKLVRMRVFIYELPRMVAGDGRRSRHVARCAAIPEAGLAAETPISAMDS